MRREALFILAREGQDERSRRYKLWAVKWQDLWLSKQVQKKKLLLHKQRIQRSKLSIELQDSKKRLLHKAKFDINPGDL